MHIIADLKEYIDLCRIPGQEITFDGICCGLSYDKWVEEKVVYSNIKRLYKKDILKKIIMALLMPKVIVLKDMILRSDSRRWNSIQCKTAYTLCYGVWVAGYPSISKQNLSLCVS